MAQRKQYRGYGTAPIPAAKPGDILPPPPDGQVPPRLPISGDPAPQQMESDPNAQLIRLLQQLGRI